MAQGDKILVTGVYGLVGRAIFDHLSTLDGVTAYGLDRHQVASERVAEGQDLAIPEDRFYCADLADREAIDAAVAGKSVVVHFAANPDPGAEIQSLIESNVLGTYNVIDACHKAGVRRIVFASSIMVSWAYTSDEEYMQFMRGEGPAPPVVTHRDLPRPHGPYSASKLWGEGLARAYSERHDISILCVRLGWVNCDDDAKGASNSFWLSQRDATNMVDCCINAPPELKFDIFYAVSNNRNRWVDIEHPRNVIGYVPFDSPPSESAPD